MEEEDIVVWKRVNWRATVHSFLRLQERLFTNDTQSGDFCGVRNPRLSFCSKFNPTSKAAAVPFLDTVSEETPGTLGVVPSVSFLDGLLSVQGYVAFQEKSHSTSTLGADGNWANLPFGLKLQGIVGSFDLSTSWIKEVLYLSDEDKYTRKHYIEVDLVGAIWNFGVYG